MVYNSFNFIVLFPLLFLLYYLIPAKLLKWRNGYLLAVSYLLYANWDPAYTLILLGVTLITFFTAQAVDIEAGRRRKVLVGGIFFDSLTFVGVQVL